MQFIPLSLSWEKRFRRYHGLFWVPQGVFLHSSFEYRCSEKGFSILKVSYQNKCALFFLVKSFGVHITVAGEMGSGWGEGRVLSMTHKLYNFCLTMLATFWSVSLNLWWCYSKHFDYLNVLRCQKTKQGRKILLIKICCCQGDCNLKLGFCNKQNPHTVFISQEFTILKRECFKIGRFETHLYVTHHNLSY